MHSDGEASLLHSLFEFAVLTTSLQIVYILGLLSDGQVGRRTGCQGRSRPFTPSQRLP